MKNSSSFQNQVIYPLLQAINRFSNRNAFYINEIFYTYGQLGQSISKIRQALKEFDKENTYLGLVANDDIETYASIFALWLEGKAYIPLHPNHPPERCEEIIHQVGIHTILDSSETSRFSKYEILYTLNLTYKEDFLDYDVMIDNDRAAYVLFTSGSTGKPKGVTITRKNLGSFMDSFWDCGISINEEDRCLQYFDLTFDVSVQSFLAPVTKAACVYTIPHDQIKYSYIYSLLVDQHLTFGAVAPSMLRYLKPYFKEIEVPSFKCCILAAEASPFDLIQKWRECIPGADIYNFYGPTEATIYCTCYKIERTGQNKTLNGMVSIGRPMKNVETIIIDDDNKILAKGERGELCISGDHITPGYWKNPEKNASAFFEKEYKGKVKRFYHTGDLCCYDNEEYIMLYGRLDSQVKVQGYRVDLGEIEFHARAYLEGKNAVVLTFENFWGNNEIALFLESKEIHTAPLVEFLKTKIPAYMIPTKIIFDQSFPLNLNGKVDKLKLKEKLT
jgi:amino acid adenylation domain-containing protein